MNEKPRILIVEDEPKIREGLRDFLEFHDFAVSVADDGLEAERWVRENRCEVILLDLMLPKISGEQLCRKWRQSGMNTPVIMVTAKGQEYERVAGLNLGADDYVTKPFSLEELLARIRAVLRRMEPGRSVGESFMFGGVEVDIGKLSVRRDGGEGEPISVREGRILQYFAANAGRVVSRAELYENVWDEPISEFGTRTVDMHIAKLRAKIEADSSEPAIIRTVRGAGYIYDSGGGGGDV